MQYLIAIRNNDSVMTTTETQPLQLGFVACLTMPDGAYVGGALVTDGLGLPVEFRHTDPVMPSRLQRVLYGRVLDNHIHNDVVAGALLGSVESKPGLYIVADAAYLPGASGFGVPAVWIGEARNAPPQEIGTRHDLSSTEYLIQLGLGNGAIRVRVNAAEKDAAAVIAAKESSARILTAAARSMELTEPMRRVEEAIRLLWDERQKVPALAA